MNNRMAPPRPGATQTTALFRLSPDQYSVLERQVLSQVVVGKETTELQAGYMLGIQPVECGAHTNVKADIVYGYIKLTSRGSYPRKTRPQGLYSPSNSCKSRSRNPTTLTICSVCKASAGTGRSINIMTHVGREAEGALDTLGPLV